MRGRRSSTLQTSCLLRESTERISTMSALIDELGFARESQVIAAADLADVSISLTPSFIVIDHVLSAEIVAGSIAVCVTVLTIAAIRVARSAEPLLWRHHSILSRILAGGLASTRFGGGKI